MSETNATYESESQDQPSIQELVLRGQALLDEASTKEKAEQEKAFQDQELRKEHFLEAVKEILPACLHPHLSFDSDYRSEYRRWTLARLDIPGYAPVRLCFARYEIADDPQFRNAAVVRTIYGDGPLIVINYRPVLDDDNQPYANSFYEASYPFVELTQALAHAHNLGDQRERTLAQARQLAKRAEQKVLEAPTPPTVAERLEALLLEIVRKELHKMELSQP